MEIRTCTRCVMDESDPLIKFDAEGVCNHCRDHDKLAKELGTTEQFKELAQELKDRRGGNKYDCVMGLSGGVDSSYAYHLAKNLALKPKLIHVDNGWDTPQSTHNIEAITKHWGDEAETIQLDLDEFKALQRSFFLAGVPDIEVPTDHAIKAVTFKTAKKLDIKHILSGTNIATETHGTKAWSYGHRDWRYINSVAESQGLKLKHFPHYTLKETALYNLRFKWISVLNYFTYNRSQALETLKKVYCYRDYGGKHQESIITRFVHGYILPRRFGFDTRRGRFSAMICSSQMTREEALERLSKPAYNPSEMEADIERFLIASNLTREEFFNAMYAPRKSYLDFASYAGEYQKDPIYVTARLGYRLLRRLTS